MVSFVIGIGSQRAGSTLLHRIIDECTDVFMHPVKELHYFDTLHDVRKEHVLLEYSREQVIREVNRIVSAREYSFIDKRYRCYLRANNLLSSMAVKNMEYIDLYRPCISDSSVLGEVTPEYMILPEKGVEDMAEKLGADTKIILLARHPVERFVSAFKLLKVYSNPKYDMKNFSIDLEDAINTMGSWMRQQDELNDYEGALNKYKKHFSKILFESYESIVSNPSAFFVRLSDFLETGIDSEKSLRMIKKKVNIIAETAEVSKELYGYLEERYKLHTAFLESYKW